MRKRVDVALVERGLAPSRAAAQAAIAEGLVQVDGAVVRRAAHAVAPDAKISFAPAHSWASRGGLKLAFALEEFGVECAGRFALDVGASTGGFTDVLLARGAAHVDAVDVGHGQLIARLRADPRVSCLEGRDARALDREDLAAPPEIVVCDASFIGLAKVIARPLELAAAEASAVLLIKPQYEAGPGAGLPDAVRAESIAADVAARLDGCAGFRLQRTAPSPIRGGDGAHEWLALLVKR